MTDRLTMDGRIVAFIEVLSDFREVALPVGLFVRTFITVTCMHKKLYVDFSIVVTCFSPEEKENEEDLTHLSVRPLSQI